jgi:hypothetical protein
MPGYCTSCCSSGPLGTTGGAPWCFFEASYWGDSGTAQAVRFVTRCRRTGGLAPFRYHCVHNGYPVAFAYPLPCAGPESFPRASITNCPLSRRTCLRRWRPWSVRKPIRSGLEYVRSEIREQRRELTTARMSDRLPAPALKSRWDSTTVTSKQWVSPDHSINRKPGDER